MAAKATKTTNKTKSTKKTSNRGKKGGMGMVSPEMIGAMTGAAIGGVTGLMLANKKTRERLAVVKDQALTTAEQVLSDVNIHATNARDEAADFADETIDNASSKIKKIKP
jgi:gas vesicle protein